MGDMLVKLYSLPEDDGTENELKKQGIHVVRVLSPDKNTVLSFIRENFSEGWASETEAGFYNSPVTVFAAVHEGKVVGFAAYDATAKGYFGPTGVHPDYRRKGIGKVLMMKCFHAMREYGYGYAIIGWAGESAKHLYAKYAGAVEIPDSHPGVYSRMIKVISKK